MKKKLISQLVCVTMALSLTPVSVLAEETNAAAEVNEGAAEGKEEGKTEPQEAPKEEVKEEKEEIKEEVKEEKKEEVKEEPQEEEKEEEQAAPQLNTMEQRSNAVAVQANDGETKNITKTGLTLGNTDNPLPTEETTYAAGGGTVTFIPAIPPATEGENGTNAKLVLDNAEINCPGFTAIAFKSEEDLDIELKGTNVFTANNGIASEGNLNIIGEGTLKIKGVQDGIEAEGSIVVNSGTIEISDFQSVGATRAGLRAKEGDVTINGGTVTIRSEESNIHGIYASQGSNENVGNVYIHGGKVDINVKGRGVYAGKNIVIDDKAVIDNRTDISTDIDVTSTGDDADGIYSYEGDITIGGNAVVKVVAEDDDGIYADDGNVKISGSANVTINSYSEAIWAGKNITINGDNDTYLNVTATSEEEEGIYSYEGNITIGGNANVTAISEDEEGIHAFKGNIEIGGNAVVTATGDEEGIEAYIDNVAISGNAKVTATGGEGYADISVGKTFDYKSTEKLAAFVINRHVDDDGNPTDKEAIAYGKCDTNNASDEIKKLDVKKGAELTVDKDTRIEIADAENLTVDGKIINNGTIVIPAEACTKLTGKLTNNNMLTIIADDSVDAAEMIKNMEMEDGDGIIRVSNSGGSVSSMYTNDGTQLKTQEAIVIKDIADATDNTPTGEYFDENGKGYSWNAATKVLTLKNIVPNKVEITSANDVTIQIVGTAYVVEEFKFFGGEAFQNKTVTIAGERVKARYIKSENMNVVIATQKANIEIIQNVFSLEGGNFYDTQDSKLIFRNTRANLNSVVWIDRVPEQEKKSNTYGVALENSNVTVARSGESSMLFAGRITMDDSSVLTLKNTPIVNYVAYPDGLDGLADFLPKDGGYTIGQDPDAGEYSISNTILDANGKIVDTIVLKKERSHSSSGGGGGSSVKQYGITVKAAENGKVEASKKSASKNAAVTLTVTAEEGYQLEKLTVVDSKNEEIKLTNQGEGKYEFKMPAGEVTVSAAFAKKAEETPETKPETKNFADVSANAWFKKAVDYVSEKGLMSGVEADKFAPELRTNRAMLVTILWRMEGSPMSEKATAFTDIHADDYFYQAVLWAAENGIVSGMSETSFAPNESITREQLAAILYRYALYKEYDVSQGGMIIREFDDYHEISEYALRSLTWALNSGIISGKGNAVLDPKGSATRAEVASMLMRFCETFVK